MKRLFYKRILWLVPLALVLAGCNRQTALVPPKIHYGLETCADCGMIINDPHYAAALAWRATPDAPAQIAVFDDIGCLLAWRQHHAGVQVAAMWVKDVQTEAWLNAPSSVYLKSDQLSTPMGWDIVAGATKSDFSELPVHGPVLTWKNLPSVEGPKSGPPAANHFEKTNP